MEADTKETMTIGKVEVNMRPMRAKVYIIMDDLNQLTNQVLRALPQETEERNAILENIKVLKRLINAL